MKKPFLSLLLLLLFAPVHLPGSAYVSPIGQCYSTLDEPRTILGRVPVLALYVNDREAAAIYVARIIDSAEALGIEGEERDYLTVREIRRAMVPMPIWAMFDDGTVIWTPDFEAWVLRGDPVEYFEQTYPKELREELTNTVRGLTEDFRQTVDLSGCAELHSGLRYEIVIQEPKKTVCISFRRPLRFSLDKSERGRMETSCLLEQLTKDYFARDIKPLAALSDEIAKSLETVARSGEPIGTLSEPPFELVPSRLKDNPGKSSD